MKVDMMSVVVNSLRSTESKSDESGLSFLEVLESNREDIDFSIDKEKESNINEELALLMSSMLNSNLPKLDEAPDISMIKDDIADSFDSLMLKEFGETLGLDISSNEDNSITIFNGLEESNTLEKVITLNVDKNSENLISIDSLARSFNSKETINTVDSLKYLDIDKNMEPSLLRDFVDFKDIGNSSIDSDIKGREKILAVLNSSSNEGHVFEIESKLNDISNKETWDLDNNNIFQFSRFKNRDIASDEGLTQHNDDISILNNIAFSSNNFDKSVEGTEVLVVREQSLGEDILQAVKYLNNNKVEELTLKMNPKDLGEINIKYLRYEGVDRVIITLSKEDTFSLVNGNIEEIKNHLINLDIGIEDVSVEVRHNNADDFSDNLNQQFNKNSSKEEKRNRATSQELDGEKKLTLEDTNINFLI